LASVAVADGDTDGISADFRLKLTATARCDANRHRNANGGSVAPDDRLCRSMRHDIP
jgi:hypothetical protein